MTRQLHLNVNALGALGAHPGAWRWPDANPLSFASVDDYVTVAQTAERGLLDAVFLADSPGLVQDISRRPPYNGLEPTLILTAIARATERIGLIGTASTTYNEPYNVARRFLTLDVISHGRAAWNAVTTYNPISARNFGTGEPSREERYARGNEFVDVVRALWQGWPPEALLADVAGGRFADTAAIPHAGHQGARFSVEGPLTLPPSEQGHPVILQAGGSSEGVELAARTADVVFAAAAELELGQAAVAELRQRAARHGRSVVVLPGLRLSIGATEHDALERRKELDELASDRATQLRGLGVKLGADLADAPLDEPVPRELLGQGDAPTPHDSTKILRRLAWEGATVRDLLSRSDHAGHHLVAVGAPEQIADLIERWFRADAADGFNLMPDVLADGLPAFVDHVVPILQRRGIFRTEYEGATLREHLGLPHPAAGSGRARVPA